MKEILIAYLGKKDQFKFMLDFAMPSNIICVDTIEPYQPFDLISRTQAGVIIADLSDGDFKFDGFTMIKTLVELLPGKAVIAMTDEFYPDALEPIKAAGAMGYINRDIAAFEPIFDVIEAVFEGKPYYLTNVPI